MTLIQAYRKDTGAKVWIPENWLGHPVWGGSFAKTPSQKARERKAEAKESSAEKKEK